MNIELRETGEKFAKQYVTHDPLGYILENIQAPKLTADKATAKLWRFSEGEQNDWDSILVLDYDEADWNDVYDILKPYKFLCHSSYRSVLVEGKPTRFRIFLPITRPYKKESLLRVVKNLPNRSSYFGNIDPSSFHNAFCYAPSCPSLDRYFWTVNEGVIFDTSKGSQFAQDCLAYVASNPSVQEPIEVARDKPQAYYDKILENLETDIQTFDINLRGYTRRTNAKIYHYVKTAEKALGTVEAAKVWVMRFARDPATVEAIKVIK